MESFQNSYVLANKSTEKYMPVFKTGAYMFKKKVFFVTQHLSLTV
jgi:hypothetical protein